MFRLYKRNRAKYRMELLTVASIIVRDKKKVKLPIQQRSRDRGGLYCLMPEFLPVVRALDDVILGEFPKHGRNLVKASICTLD